MANGKGFAISIVSGLDIGTLYALTRWMKIRLEERPVPTNAQIRGQGTKLLAQRLVTEAQEAEPPDELPLGIAEELLSQADARLVLAQLVRERLAAPTKAQEVHEETQALSPESASPPGESRSPPPERGRGRGLRNSPSRSSLQSL